LKSIIAYLLVHFSNTDILHSVVKLLFFKYGWSLSVLYIHCQKCFKVMLWYEGKIYVGQVCCLFAEG